MLKNNIIYNDYSDWKFDISKARGDFIWDKSGKKLIDFTSGWNVTNLGWNNQEVNSAMASQAKKNTYAPMWTADSIQNEYAKALVKSLPETLVAVGRATGGTEANEMAIKTARAYTGKKRYSDLKIPTTANHLEQCLSDIYLRMLKRFLPWLEDLSRWIIQM